MVKKFNRINFSIFMSSIAMVLIIVIGVTYAWLSDIKNKYGNAIIGEVGIEFYSNGTQLGGEVLEDGSYVVGIPLEVTFGELNSKVTFDLTVKNTGTIPGIVRCFIAITDDEGPHNHYTDLDGAHWIIQTNQVAIEQDNWVTLYDDPDISDQYFFNSFLNEQLAAGASKTIIKSATPYADGMQNKTVYIYIRADIVAYSGNAYQVDTEAKPTADIDKPFGVLTDEFLEIWTAWK
jgi:predicted ribosomally synthesized peptide with SipW-like signal peptide